MRILKLFTNLKFGGSTMGKYFVVFELLNLAYSNILRSLVLKAIDDPDSEVDELVMSILDRLFNYKEAK